ncbi:MAG: ABC transporter substrate-binding protein [Rhodospirillales bacterium]
MKKLLGAVFGFALTVTAFAGAAQADKIRIGTEGAYPPFNQINDKGELIGFDIDIAKALCAEMKAECEFVTQDWDGIIPGLLAKKYDAIVASMSITEERMKAVDFTDYYYSNSLRFIAKGDTKLDPTMLDGKSIGAQRATIAAQYLEDNMKGITPKLYDTQENAYLDLAAGRLDAVLADALVNYEWLRSEAGQDYAFLGKAIDINDKIGIAVRKGEGSLVKRFNAALKTILANGTYQKINTQYFPFSIY